MMMIKEIIMILIIILIIIVFYLLLAEQPGVLQVVPSRTLQLHSGPGIAKLH